MASRRVSRRRFVASTAAASTVLVAAPFVRGAYAAGKLTVGFWDHWVPNANDATSALVKEWADKEKVELTTAYGKLSIPVADVRRIDFGTRIPEDVAKKIDAAIANLSSDNFQTREDATALLRTRSGIRRRCDREIELPVVEHLRPERPVHTVTDMLGEHAVLELRYGGHGLLRIDIDDKPIWDGGELLRPRSRYLIKQTSRSAVAVVDAIEDLVDVHTLERVAAPQELSLNDIGRVHLRTSTPLVFYPYTSNRRTGSFILIDEASNRTVGAGMIAAAEQHRPREHRGRGV